MKKQYPLISIFNPRKLRSLLSFGVKGYLAETGWLRSFKDKMPVGPDGEPLPWVTYSFIDFIKERLKRDQVIFEFGSGNSTFFYANYVREVVSVEHDKSWLEKIQANKPSNAEMIWCELETGGDYCNMPLKLNRQFDIIIVDGRDRVNCCRQSIDALTERGVLVLDDSEREKYTVATSFMKSKGFKQLSFSGISPGFFYQKATSVFYKPGNCLDI